jgi:hypothetical protein
MVVFLCENNRECVDDNEESGRFGKNAQKKMKGKVF